MSKNQWKLEESVTTRRPRRRAAQLRAFFGQYDESGGGAGTTVTPVLPITPNPFSFSPTPTYPTPLTPVNPLTPFSPPRTVYQPPPPNSYTPPPAVYVPPPPPVNTYTPPPITPVTPVLQPPPTQVVPNPINAILQSMGGAYQSYVPPDPTPVAAAPAPITPVTPTITVSQPVYTPSPLPAYVPPKTVTPVVQSLNQNLPPSRAAAPVVYTQAAPQQYVSPSAPVAAAPVASSGRWVTQKVTSWDDSYDSAVPTTKNVTVWVPNTPSYSAPATTYVPPVVPMTVLPSQVLSSSGYAPSAPVYAPPVAPIVLPSPAYIQHPAIALAQTKSAATQRSLDSSSAASPGASSYLNDIFALVPSNRPTDYQSGLRFRDGLFNYFLANRSRFANHTGPTPMINGKKMETVLKESHVSDDAVGGSSDESMTQDFQALWDFFNGMRGLKRAADAFAKRVNLTKAAAQQAYNDVMQAGAVTQQTTQAVITNAQQTGASAPEVVTGPVESAILSVNKGLNTLVLLKTSEVASKVAANYALMELASFVKSYIPKKKVSPFDYVVPTSTGLMPTLEVLTAMKSSGEQAASDALGEPFVSTAYVPQLDLPSAPARVSPTLTPPVRNRIPSSSSYRPQIDMSKAFFTTMNAVSALDVLKESGGREAAKFSGRAPYVPAADAPLPDPTYSASPSSYAAVTGGNALDALASVKTAATQPSVSNTGSLSDSNFNSVVNRKGVVVVMFGRHSTGPNGELPCGVCRSIEKAGYVQQAAAKQPNVGFYYADLNDAPQAGAANKVSTLPNFMVFKDGVLAVDQNGTTLDFVGLIHNPETLINWAAEATGSKPVAVSTPVLQPPPQTYTQAAPVAEQQVQAAQAAGTLTDATFKQAISGSGYTIVKIGFPGCHYCIKTDGGFDQAALNTPGVSFYHVNRDVSPKVESFIGTNSYPTFVVYKGGREVNRVVGMPDDFSSNTVRGMIPGR